MAKPKKEIILRDLDPEKLTVDEMCLFEPEGFSMNRLRDFIAKYSNWTLGEVGKLTLTELNEVAGALSEQLDEVSVPLQKDAF